MKLTYANATQTTTESTHTERSDTPNVTHRPPATTHPRHAHKGREERRNPLLTPDAASTGDRRMLGHRTFRDTAIYPSLDHNKGETRTKNTRTPTTHGDVTTARVGRSLKGLTSSNCNSHLMIQKVLSYYSLLVNPQR